MGFEDTWRRTVGLGRPESEGGWAENCAAASEKREATASSEDTGRGSSSSPMGGDASKEPEGLEDGREAESTKLLFLRARKNECSYRRCARDLYVRNAALCTEQLATTFSPPASGP